MVRRKEPRIPDHLLEQLLAGADANSAFAKDGLLDALKKALAERALNAEMDHHLDRNYSPYGRRSHGRSRLQRFRGAISRRNLSVIEAGWNKSTTKMMARLAPADLATLF